MIPNSPAQRPRIKREIRCARFELRRQARNRVETMVNVQGYEFFRAGPLLPKKVSEPIGPSIKLPVGKNSFPHPQRRCLGRSSNLFFEKFVRASP